MKALGCFWMLIQWALSIRRKCKNYKQSVAIETSLWLIYYFFTISDHYMCIFRRNNTTMNFTCALLIAAVNSYSPNLRWITFVVYIYWATKVISIPRQLSNEISRELWICFHFQGILALLFQSLQGTGLINQL